MTLDARYERLAARIAITVGVPESERFLTAIRTRKDAEALYLKSLDWLDGREHIDELHHACECGRRPAYPSAVYGGPKFLCTRCWWKENRAAHRRDPDDRS